MNCRLQLVAVAFVGALAYAAASAETYRLIDLGTLSGNNAEGTALNDAGQVTGWSALAAAQTSHTFLWEDGTTMDLGTFGGLHSAGMALPLANCGNRK